MPKVVLEFEVTQKGATVKQVVSETERAFAALKASAAGSGEALARTAQASDRAHLSFREMGRTTRELTMNLAAQQPILGSLVFHFASFARMLGNLGPIAGTVAGTVVALTAAFVGHLARTEELRVQQVALSRAVWETDFSALRGGLKESAAALDEVNSADATWLGYLKNLPTLLFQGVTAYDKAAQKLREYHDQLERILPLEDELNRLRFEQQRAGLQVGGIEAGLTAAATRGTLRPTDVLSATGKEEDLVRAAGAAAAEEAKTRATMAIRQATVNGEIETGLMIRNIRAALARELILIEDKIGQEIFQRRQANQARLVALAQQDLADQTAIAREGMTRRVAIATQEEAMFAAIRQARTNLAAADASGGEIERFRQVREIEMSGIRDTLAATRQASSDRIGEAERLRTQLVAMLQGQLAQQLITERDYTNQVRQLDTELANAKLASLGQYGQALQGALARATADYTKYTDEVRRLDEQLRQTKNETADILAGIKQEGMSPAEAFADREKRAGEKLTQAMELSGQAQMEALRAVQREYANLAMEAQRARQTQEGAARAPAEAQGPWVTELPGEASQHAAGQTSQAWQQFWKTPATGPGSAEWWSGGAWGNNAWSRASGGQTQAADPKALADKVTEIGKKIEEAQNKAKTAAEDSAKAAKAAAEEHIKALEGIKAQLDTVQGPAGMLEESFRKSASLSRDMRDYSGALVINLDQGTSAADRLTASLLAAAAAGQNLGTALGPGGWGTPTLPSIPSGLSEGISSALQSAANSIVDEIRGGIEGNQQLGESITQPSSPSGLTWGEPGDYGGYQHGGRIPGSPGEPVQVPAHAGEFILNRAEQAVVRDLTGGAGIDAQRLADTILGGIRNFDTGSYARAGRIPESPKEPMPVPTGVGEFASNRTEQALAPALIGGAGMDPQALADAIVGALRNRDDGGYAKADRDVVAEQEKIGAVPEEWSKAATEPLEEVARALDAIKGQPQAPQAPGGMLEETFRQTEALDRDKRDYRRMLIAGLGRGGVGIESLTGTLENTATAAEELSKTMQMVRAIGFATPRAVAELSAGTRAAIPVGGYAGGGRIPGFPGEPVQVPAHAGEFILNRAEQAVVRDLTGGAGIDAQRLADTILGGIRNFDTGSYARAGRIPESPKEPMPVPTGVGEFASNRTEQALAPALIGGAGMDPQALADAIVGALRNRDDGGYAKADRDVVAEQEKIGAVPEEWSKAATEPLEEVARALDAIKGQPQAPQAPGGMLEETFRQTEALDRDKRDYRRMLIAGLGRGGVGIESLTGTLENTATAAEELSKTMQMVRAIGFATPRAVAELSAGTRAAIPVGGYAGGGRIPGFPGEPVQVPAHAGEFILNRAEQAVVRDLTGGAGIDAQRLADTILGGIRNFDTGSYARAGRISESPKEPVPVPTRASEFKVSRTEQALAPALIGGAGMDPQALADAIVGALRNRDDGGYAKADRDVVAEQEKIGAVPEEWSKAATEPLEEVARALDAIKGQPQAPQAPGGMLEETFRQTEALDRDKRDYRRTLIAGLGRGGAGIESLTGTLENTATAAQQLSKTMQMVRAIGFATPRAVAELSAGTRAAIPAGGYARGGRMPETPAEPVRVPAHAGAIKLDRGEQAVAPPLIGGAGIDAQRLADTILGEIRNFDSGLYAGAGRIPESPKEPVRVPAHAGIDPQAVVDATLGGIRNFDSGLYARAGRIPETSAEPVRVPTLAGAIKLSRGEQAVAPGLTGNAGIDPQALADAVGRAIREGAAGAAIGGDLHIHLKLDGRSIAPALRIPLQDAIRAGQIELQGTA